jgi:hypothetical protein
VNEFDTGDTGADHRDAVGEHLRRVAIAGGEDAVVWNAPLGDARSGPGGDEHRIGGDLSDTVGGGDLDVARRQHARRPVQHGDALAVEEARGVVLEVPLDALDALTQRLDVDLGVGLFEAHPFEAAGERHRSASGDHGLRRDAVPQVSSATDDIAFDQCDLGAEPRCMRGRSIACGSATDDHEACRHERGG